MHFLIKNKKLKFFYLVFKPLYNSLVHILGQQPLQGDGLSDVQTEYSVKNPISLDQLNLSTLDSQTRLILEEKEQALLASQETVQVHCHFNVV